MTKQHAFTPRFDGKGCSHIVEWVDHRSVECKAMPDDPVHDGTRPAPPGLEFPFPPCSVCGKTTDHDGDGFYCSDCGISWGEMGEGRWDDPEEKACLSAFKPFDRDNLAPEHEKIRHHIVWCFQSLDHAGKHRSDEFTTWTDEQAVSVS